MENSLHVMSLKYILAKPISLASSRKLLFPETKILHCSLCADCLLISQVSEAMPEQLKIVHLLFIITGLRHLPKVTAKT